MTERILFSIHPRYLITRIAENSSILNDIQDQGGDGFNISEGYPQVYAKPFSDGGKPLNRAELNNIFNLLSQLHFYWQMGGSPVWDSRIAKGEGMYAPLRGYPRNAKVYKMVGNELIEFISQIDNNEYEPVIGDTEHWKRVTLGDDAATKAELLELSGYAKTTDQRLGSSISIVDSRVTTISGYAKTVDQALGTAISTLSGNAKATDIALGNSISTLSGNAKSTDTWLANQIAALSGGAGGNISALEQKISTLSANAKTTDGTLATSIATLSSNAKTVDQALGTSISTLSGNAKATDIALGNSISTLSGNAKNTDEFLFGKILEISGGGGGGGGGGSISSLEKRLDEITTAVSSLMLTVGNLQSTIEGLDGKYLTSFFDTEVNAHFGILESYFEEITIDASMIKNLQWSGKMNPDDENIIDLDFSMFQVDPKSDSITIFLAIPEKTFTTRPILLTDSSEGWREFDMYKYTSVVDNYEVWFYCFNAGHLPNELYTIGFAI